MKTRHPRQVDRSLVGKPGPADSSGVRPPLLLVSNLYPPEYIGGYELGCWEVVTELRRRGWPVTVLTSRRSTQKGGGDPGNGRVLRLLHNDFVRWPRSSVAYGPYLTWREVMNRRAFHHAVRVSQPGVVYVWSPRFISASVIFHSQQAGLRPLLYVSDNWLSELETTDRWLSWSRREVPRLPARLAKKALGLPLRAIGGRFRLSEVLEARAQFASEFLRSGASTRGLCAVDSPVIHWGVDPDVWRPPDTPANLNRLLYVGQVVAHKGVHTAIEAVRRLRDELGYSDVTMTIVGTGVDSAYVERVSSMVSSAGLSAAITFAGRLDRSELPGLYRSHGIMIFPSEWDEPFSITLLEAMSSGLPVVATLTGGTPEVLVPGVNGLGFVAGDVEACALGVWTLLQSPDFARQLGEEARKTILAGFRLTDMVSRIERDLLIASAP